MDDLLNFFFFFGFETRWLSCFVLYVGDYIHFLWSLSRHNAIHPFCQTAQTVKNFCLWSSCTEQKTKKRFSGICSTSSRLQTATAYVAGRRTRRPVAQLPVRSPSAARPRSLRARSCAQSASKIGKEAVNKWFSGQTQELVKRGIVPKPGVWRWASQSLLWKLSRNFYQKPTWLWNIRWLGPQRPWILHLVQRGATHCPKAFDNLGETTRRKKARPGKVSMHVSRM